MDVQLKRGLLEVCVLAVIRNKPSYGYQIIKDMITVLGTGIADQFNFNNLRYNSSSQVL